MNGFWMQCCILALRFVSVKFIYAILWIDLIDSFAKKSPELECQA